MSGKGAPIAVHSCNAAQYLMEGLCSELVLQLEAHLEAVPFEAGQLLRTGQWT